MTDELAASLPRRVLAWFVDVGLVAVLSGVVAVTQAEAFSAVPELTSAQQDRIADLTSGPSISWTVGETTRIWAGTALWTTAAATALILLIVLALLPANVGGWTPGMRLTGLRVITVSGNRARLHHHVIRNAVGLVDMFPFVIPGLLGWIVAWRSPDKQRLGDRAAGTRVVDRRHPERPIDPGTQRSRWSQLSEEPATRAPAVFDEMETAARNWAVLDVDADLPPTVAHTVARTVEKGRVGGAKPLDSVLPPVRRDQRRHAATSDRPPAPLSAAERAAAQLSGRERPQEQRAREPQPAPAEPHALVEPTEHVDRELDPTTDLFRRLALGEPAEGSETVNSRDLGHAAGASASGPTSERTVWSDELGAWMYRDTNTGRWLKHDSESDQWVPVD